MNLEQLAAEIERVAHRIDTHRAELDGNETKTRYALIDPILRALGWDTGDPTRLKPEHRSGDGQGIADYDLCVPDQATGQPKPFFIVEAKKLGEKQLRQALTQSIAYSVEHGAKYFAVTNGDVWEIYDVEKSGPVGEKLALRVELRRADAADIAVRLVPFSWVRLVSPASAVNTGLPTHQRDTGQIEVSLGTYIPSDRYEDAPDALRFPNGSETGIKDWNAVIEAVARWLEAEGSIGRHVDGHWIEGQGNLIYQNGFARPSGRYAATGKGFVRTRGLAEDTLNDAAALIFGSQANPRDFTLVWREKDT